jgi:hypothetical protein
LADAEVMARTLNAKQEYLSASVVALKPIRMPSPDVAIAPREMGVRAVLEIVEQDSLAEEPQINASVDTPDALRRHEFACGGNSNR